eukprot:103027_1
MKWISIICLLPVASFAFQLPSVDHGAKTSLGYYPDKFARAEQCATHNGLCDIAELEELADELDQFQHSHAGESQDGVQYKDTKKVTDILHAKSELKHMMNDYVNEHHEETFDMSNV